MWADLPIFGGYGRRQAVAFDSEDLINLFSVQNPGGKKKFAFLGSPGLKNQLTVSGGYGRELFPFSNNLYAGVGNAVYRIDTNFIQTHIGTIGTSSGDISITANNNNQIIFVDGQNGYIYDTGAGTFTPISSGFPNNPLNVAFLDGYFVVPVGNSRTFQISAINDGTSWDPLDEAQIQAYPGLNVGVGVVNRRLYFFKTDSTEVWYNNGSADFPFRRDNNLLFNFGCMATSSIVSDFGYLFWLARDEDGVGSVMMTTGQEAVPVSNESIDNLIASFTRPDDVDAYVYKDLGHIFLVMSWTTDDVTLVYNLNLKEWSKMEMEKHLEIPGVPYSGKTRHLSNAHAYFNNQHIVTSYKNSTLYDLSRNNLANQIADGDIEPIRRSRTCPHFFDTSYRRMQIANIQLDMQMGLGLESSPYSDIYTNLNEDPILNPQVYLSLSRDGGNVYGNRHPAPMGRIGQRQARALFKRLGTARNLVPRFEIFAPVGPIAILGASINYEVLQT